jgi:protein O-GlcNAc transferase
MEFKNKAYLDARKALLHGNKELYERLMLGLVAQNDVGPEPTVEYVRYLISTQRFSDAYDILAMQSENAPSTPDLQRLFFISMVGAGRDKEALVLLEGTPSLLGDNDVKNAAAVAFMRQHHLDLAIKLYREILVTHPGHLGAAYNLARCLFQRGGLSSAENILEKYIPNPSDFPPAFGLYADLAYLKKNYDLAADLYGRAHSRLGDSNFLIKRFDAIRHGLRWDRYDAYQDEFLEALRTSRTIKDPFAATVYSDDPLVQLEGMKRSQWSFERPAPLTSRLPKGGKIRIAYCSSDFYPHATMQLIGDVLLAHDSNRFEINILDYGRKAGYYRKLFERGGVKYFDLSKMSTKEFAAFSATKQFDVLVDLKGYTFDGRPDLCADINARVTVNFLGFPGTTGSKLYDYIFADHYLIPVGAEPYYSETVFRLPHTYQPRSIHGEFGKILMTIRKNRRETTRDDGVMFGCLNAPYKLTPQFLRLCSEVLMGVDRSRLLLLVDTEIQQKRILDYFQGLDVRAHRISFHLRGSYEGYLNALASISVFLDTSPCGAHTTASDALILGLPLVTLTGNTFATRVAGSLLNEIGCDELITKTPRNFVDTAIQLGTDLPLLQSFETRIYEGLPSTVWADPSRFSRSLEAAYRQIA